MTAPGFSVGERVQGFRVEHMMAHSTHAPKRPQAARRCELRLGRWSVGVAMFLVALAVTPARGAGQLSLQVASGSTMARLGDVITVTLDVAGLTAPINGIQAFVHYDPSVLRLVDVVGNESVGTGWMAITEDRGSGDFLQLLVMLGGETAIDHSAATLTFEAIALGSTSITFLVDVPPLRAKLTAAADASPILPVTVSSEQIVIGAVDIPTVSEWGLATMALLLMTMGSLVVRKNLSTHAND